MNKILFVLTVSIFLISCLSAKENVVIFTIHGDNPNSSYLLSIAEPLDGIHNCDIATFKQTITDSSSVEFIYKKQYPAVIVVDVAERKFNVIMQPNTTVYVDIYPQILNNDWVIFRGDNAVGHKLYNAKPLEEWFMEIQKIFIDNKKNYPALITNIENYMNTAIYQIDSLRALTEISSSFAEVFKKDWQAIGYYWVLNGYDNLFFSTARDDNNILAIADSIAIQDSRNKIFDIFPPLAPDILTYTWGFFYLNGYIFVRYHDKEWFSDKRYIPAFGAFSGRYGFLPDNFQKPLLGYCIARSYAYNSDEVDKVKATAYFRGKYPDSEYLPIIDKMAERYKQSQAEILKENVYSDTIATTEENKNILNLVPPNSGIYIDTSAVASNINTLKELHSAYFKGKKIFIDLWATWCRPCVQEFAHKEQFDSLLRLHNITPVFLSMDSPRFKKQWIQFIYNKKLTGYHFLLNDTLAKDIRRIANYSELSAMPIPHYIYMDEQGNIIKNNAPRPSEIEKLADLFSEKQRLLDK
jgi:thiol-disulfide isomerase/thioredoxin